MRNIISLIRIKFNDKEGKKYDWNRGLKIIYQEFKHVLILIFVLFD